MPPGDLESDLRDCLRRLAAQAPRPTDLAAELALRRARVVRRRQAGAGVVAVMVVVASVALLRPVVLGAPRPVDMAADRPPIKATEAWNTSVPAGAPDLSAAPSSNPVPHDELPAAALPVDVVIADELRTTAGGRVDLGGLGGGITAAYQIADGWLVVRRDTDTGDISLWHATLGAVPQSLLSGVDSVVVAAAGDRVAWRDGGRVYAGALRDGARDRDAIVPLGDTVAEGGATPVTFVGAGLLLARKETEDLSGSYAIWLPEQGDKRLRWRVAMGVYGTLPDGHTIVAQVPGTGGQDTDTCLALMDGLAELVVRVLACDVPLLAGAGGWISPDGRWLVAERTPAESVLIDLDGAFNDRKSAVGSGPRPNGPGVWTDASTVVYGAAGYLARLRLDRLAAGEKDAVEQIKVLATDDQPVLAVPRLSK